MAKDLNRPLRYAPCMRCDCPLTLFFTDRRHRFLCVRCHEDMVRKAPRSVNPCFCADIQSCKKCLDREGCFRYRKRNLAKRTKLQREYRLLNSEKLKEQKRRENAAYRARKRAKKEAAANAAAQAEEQDRDSK